MVVAVALLQGGERLGLVERRQVLALQILDQRELVAVTGGQERGDAAAAELAMGQQPQLAGDEDVAVVAGGLDDHRLQESVPLDRGGEGLRIDRLARLVGVRLDEVEFDDVGQGVEVEQRVASGAQRRADGVTPGTLATSLDGSRATVVLPVTAARSKSVVRRIGSKIRRRSP